MDSSDSPFSNLDLRCTWTGDPRREVEVLVEVDVSWALREPIRSS